MIKEVIAKGSTIDEAQANARAALGAGLLDDVNFELLDRGSNGVFGFFARPAQVRAYIELPDKEERKVRERRQKNNGQKKNNNHNNNQKKNNNNQQKSAAPKTESAKPAAAVPECNLKLTKREVSLGEDMSFEFVRELISNIGLKAEAELYSCDDGTRRIIIAGEDAAVLIGHHGDTLDALQYLANLASMKKNANGERDKSRVTLDIEGYRAKREETLRALARAKAAKVLRNKRSLVLEPMSAYERRIIHSEIQSIEGVSTNSVGSDNNRKVVIFLTDKQPKEFFDSHDEPLTPAIDDNSEVIEGEAVNTSSYEGVAEAEAADDSAIVAIEQTAVAEEATADDERAD